MIAWGLKRDVLQRGTGREGMKDTSVKDKARLLVDDLPEDATWDDLMDRICACKAIEAGLRNSEAGRTLDVTEVRARFNLD